MRVLLFANNWVGWKIAAYLQTQEAEIVGLVIHPKERRKYGQEIIEATGLDASNIYDGSELRDRAVIGNIKGLQPELGLSVLFGYILKQELIDIFPSGCINVHPAFLPYNRGAHPNVWSIIDNTPAGVTIHFIDAGVDTGNIISQQRVKVMPVDTGETVYKKLELASIELFQNTWPLILSGQIPSLCQSEEGTFHLSKDVDRIDEINLDRTYTARKLINILRARTFPPYRGAFFYDGRQKVFIQVQLQYEPRDLPER